MKNMWDNIAKSYNEVSLFSNSYKNKLNVILEEVLKRPHQDILDIGCGTCVLEKRLAKNSTVKNVYAIDSSAEMLKIAKKNLRKTKKVHLLKHSLQNPLPFKNSCFDQVLAINIIFCIKNQEELLNEINRVLRVNGTLIIVNPKPQGRVIYFFLEQFKDGFWGNLILIVRNAKHIIAMLVTQKKIDKLNKRGAMYYKKKEEIIRILNRSGFSLNKIESIQASQNWLFVASKK